MNSSMNANYCYSVQNEQMASTTGSVIDGLLDLSFNHITSLSLTLKLGTQKEQVGVF